MPSASSSASAISSSRSCAHCGTGFTGHGNRRLCGDECRREVARLRAAAWVAENGHRDDVRRGRQAAARRYYERTVADPARLAKRREHTATWRAANRDKIRAQERAYRQANPDAIREKLHRRRARLLDAYVAPVDADDIWQRDEGMCGICREPIDRSLTWPHPRSRTHDHIVALADGGTHEPDNVQLAHAACNSRKGADVQRRPLL